MSKIQNPTVPFNFTVPGGHVHPGQVIKVKGTPEHSANRFCINLIHNATMNYILHFDFRFDQGQTVRNTKYHSWGHEDRSPLTIQRGHAFKVKIHCLHDRYRIDVNGHHYCDYVHRAPLQEADSLRIEGDVSIQSVKFS